MTLVDQAVLTMDPDKFVDTLQTGDVLLLDKMKLGSHLIEWLDMVPRSHCAIYVDGQMLHCGKQGLVCDSIETWTHDPTRTMTALRHLDPSLDVVARAYQLMEKGGSYDYLAVACLALPCFYRSRHESIPHGIMDTALTAYGKGHLGSFTCSSFVYRCFIEAGMKLKLDHPLHTIDGRSPAWTVTPRDIWESPSFTTAAILYCQ